MGRNTSGVKAVRFRKGDYAVGMVIASPEWTLLTACENGYGKRTPIGPNGEETAEEEETADGRRQTAEEEMMEDEMVEKEIVEEDEEAYVEQSSTDSAAVCRLPSAVSSEEDENDENSNLRYTTKRRGGLGLVSIKTTARNGSVIGICRVRDEDEVMMITARGQIQRFAVTDVRVMGRNTQGVRLMNLDDGDTLVAIKRVPIIAGAKIEGAAESETADSRRQTAEEEETEAGMERSVMTETEPQS